MFDTALTIAENLADDASYFETVRATLSELHKEGTLDAKNLRVTNEVMDVLEREYPEFTGVSTQVLDEGMMIFIQQVVGISASLAGLQDREDEADEQPTVH
jgi:hypothetical protein